MARNQHLNAAKVFAGLLIIAPHIFGLVAYNAIRIVWPDAPRFEMILYCWLVSVAFSGLVAVFITFALMAVIDAHMEARDAR